MAKVYEFLANGFEEIEGLAPVDILRRGGVEVKTVSITGSEWDIPEQQHREKPWDSLFSGPERPIRIAQDGHQSVVWLFLQGSCWSPPSTTKNKSHLYFDTILYHDPAG